MASKPKRTCMHPRCPELTDGTWCPKHQAEADARKAEATQHYDRYVRPAQVKAFYRSPEWEAMRLRVLQRDHYLCQPCLRTGRVTTANTAHHLVEVRKDWSRRLDTTNLESICPPCHNRMRAEAAER